MQDRTELEEYRKKAFNQTIVVSAKEYDRVRAEDTNPIEKYMRELTNQAIEYKEKALRETAIQGYEYLIFKNTIVYDGNTATIKSKYQGIKSLTGVAIKVFENQGFEVYKLDKVREYLKNEESI